MQLTTSLALALCALGLQGAVATPIIDDPNNAELPDIGSLELGPNDDNVTSLVRRASGDDPNNPIIAELKMEAGKLNQLPFEADCYAMLCLGAPKVLQRVVAKVIEKNRRTSGVCASPFKRGKAKYKTKIPGPNPSWGFGKDNDSPEEYPFASTLQGGEKAFLFPVSVPSQNSQGGTLNGLYRTYQIKQYDPSKAGTPGAEDGTWFRIKFTGALGPYCKALMANDKTVCAPGYTGGQGDWGFDVADYAQKYDKQGGKYDLVPRT